MKHALLAFSGGLDTTFCVLWLREQGYRVTTATVDTGGFSGEELQRIAGLSASLGAEGHLTVDATEHLFQRYLRFLLFGNVLRNGAYPLSVSAERVCQATRVVELGRQVGATALAHGSTGSGNDQVRFDVAFSALAPDLELLTPIRQLALSRDQEMDFLKERGVVLPERMRTYSVNEGLWGASVGGAETHDPWLELPEAAYPGGVPDPTLPTVEHILAFEQGVPVALDGEALAPVALVQRLNALGRSYGLGRGVHLGDTILGIKGRVGFEAPGPHLLIAAHRELEKLVLTGKQLFWKDHLGSLYGGLLHEGQFFDPLARDLEAFLASSQTCVSGEVRVRLAPGRFQVLGSRSPHGLMNRGVASYGETSKAWTGEEAAGFTKVFGVSQVLALGARGGYA